MTLTIERLIIHYSFGSQGIFGRSQIAIGSRLEFSLNYEDVKFILSKRQQQNSS